MYASSFFGGLSSILSFTSLVWITPKWVTVARQASSEKVRRVWFHHPFSASRIYFACHPTNRSNHEIWKSNEESKITLPQIPLSMFLFGLFWWVNWKQKMKKKAKFPRFFLLLSPTTKTQLHIGPRGFFSGPTTNHFPHIMKGWLHPYESWTYVQLRKKFPTKKQNFAKRHEGSIPCHWHGRKIGPASVRR